MKKIVCGLAAALAMSSATAFAGPYFGATFNRTSTEFDDIKDANGYSLVSGYEFDHSTYATFFELAHYDSGDFDTGLQDVTLKYRGPQILVGGALKVAGGSSLWIKGGYQMFEGYIDGAIAIDGQATTISESVDGFTAGIGFDWMFAPAFALRLAVETPLDVDMYPGIPEKDEKQLSVLQVGLIWRPGTSDTPYAPPASYSSPVSSTYAPSAAPMPAAAPVQAPVVQAPMSSATQNAIGSGYARAGSSLLANPKPGARVLSTLSASMPVDLLSSIVNNDGQWWYVGAGDRRGWLHESQLLQK